MSAGKPSRFADRAVSFCCFEAKNTVVSSKSFLVCILNFLILFIIIPFDLDTMITIISIFIFSTVKHSYSPFVSPYYRGRKVFSLFDFIWPVCIV